ncbi:cation:proton antiporter [Nostocaceae cyanobacterium CENA357]|uniref:Cation:proton antiporter n=1 Tax=Atlanticothrix silvestris CENA357 TaxID=1725252 RepID=A0A8J7L8B3_9CYAN|nr:cation:proton antiporter [Atlanticothrix silvestris]MBH8555967.1 cation:proton antiporter [Atlanticothrix silvestris CENA357]
MLASVLWVLIIGFFGGQLARRLGAPPLIGMILVGIILGPQVRNVISEDVLGAADELRTLAVMIILMKAGLGLDREKLAQQGSVALRLGFLPAAIEAIAIAFAAMVIFKFDFPIGLLLGCVIGAESPAVIVPGMLRLKSLGWGVTKGIPDAILTGSALSDVLLLLVFSLLLSFLGDGGIEQIVLPGGFTFTALQLLPLQIIMQIFLGVLLGYLAARLLVVVLTKQNWTQNIVQDTVIAASLALFLVIVAHDLPYFSGYLAAMAMGFFLIELDAPLARRLRGGFDSLWIVAEIFLFVLLGATIQLQVLEKILLPGILILAIGLLIGRMLGWYLSTLGSNWNWRERLFLLPGNSAKATVQAAIGAIPLSQGIAGGETILAIAALSILITAPLGAWSTMTFAPKLLTKGEVDPTKVTVSTRTLLLAAVDTSSLATEVLTKVADLARRSNGEAIILHVINTSSQQDIQQIKQQTKQLLSDIKYEFLTITGAVPEEIIRIAEEFHVTAIVMGKRGHQPWEQVLLGSVSQAVLETSHIPVILLENREYDTNSL